MIDKKKEAGFILLKIFSAIFFTIIVAGIIFVVYVYIDAKDKAIRTYREIYQQGDLKALEAFSTPNYRGKETYSYRKIYFQEGTKVSIDLSDPGVEISDKVNSKNEFVLRSVPFIIESGNRKLKELRNITFKKVNLFKYGLEDEEYVPIDNVRSAKKVGASELEFSRQLQSEFDKKLPTTRREIVKQILATINYWKIAWCTKNIDAYMSVYSERSRTLRVTVDRNGHITRTRFLKKTELRQHMIALNKEYKNIVVEVYNPRIKIYNENALRIEEIVVEASFGQLYSARKGYYTYTDFGTKILRFRYENNLWKIAEETWLPRREQMKEFREKYPGLFQN